MNRDTKEILSINYNQPRAFTLIELMAVVVVILLLVVISLKIAGPIQQRVSTQRTKAEITTISAALEMYKSETGFYPFTNADGKRNSNTGAVESRNNFDLYRALTGSAQPYLKFPKSRIRVHAVTGLTNIFDDFEMPFVYYNSPSTAYEVANVATNLGYTVGGQINKLSFDLYSYGPDQLTYIPPFTQIVGPITNLISASACACGTGAWANSGPAGRFRWDSAASATDDIVNWSK